MNKMEFAGYIFCTVCFSAVCSLPIDSNQPNSGKKSQTSMQKGKDEISELREEVVHLHTIERARRFGTKIASSNLQAYTDQSDNIRYDMRSLNTNVVGFTVILPNNAIDLPTGSTVIYDDVYYNAGNGYDKTTGIFTCPRSGMYIFFLNVKAVYGRQPAAILLKINGSARSLAIAESMDNTHDATGSNLVVQHIVEGDRVWVETYLYDNQDLYQDFTAFSGVLIQST